MKPPTQKHNQVGYYNCTVVIFVPILHNENMPFQIYWKFHHQKTESFQIKKKLIFFFHVSAQNIDCGTR